MGTFIFPAVFLRLKFKFDSPRSHGDTEENIEKIIELVLAQRFDNVIRHLRVTIQNGARLFSVSPCLCGGLLFSVCIQSEFT